MSERHQALMTESECGARVSDDMDCIWVSPGRMSGQPCIYGHRLPTHQMALAHFTATPLEEITQLYGITRSQLLVACWFEARHGNSRVLRSAWKRWLREWEGALWEGGRENVPLPPQKEGWK